MSKPYASIPKKQTFNKLELPPPSANPNRDNTLPLPPPPTFDPGVLNNLGTSYPSSTAAVRRSTHSKPLEKGRVLESLSLSSLPTPPPLPSKSCVLVSKSSPHSSTTVAMTSSTAGDQKLSNRRSHEMTESIPNLDSAPNSGNYLLGVNHGERPREENNLTSGRGSMETAAKSDRSIDEEEPGQIIGGRKENPTPPLPILMPKKKRITTNTAAPALEKLSPTQSHIPILLLSTSSAKSLASKNNLTLPELFTAMGNSLPTHAPSILGRLAPFRSANRSIMLNWELFHLIFYDAENFHVRDKTTDDTIHGEKVLECACDLWQEDLQIVGNKKGLDLVGLEERVGNMISSLQEENNNDTDSQANVDDNGSGGSVQAPMMTRTDSNTEFDKNPKDYNANAAEKAAADKAFDLVSSHQKPWLLRFRSALDQITSHLPHDMLNSPPLCLFVASTSECRDRSSLVNCLAELSSPHHLPTSYQNGLIDPGGLRRQYVILHDEIDGPKDFKEGALLQEMHQRFGPGCCAVLRINSLSPNPTQKGVVEDAVWDNFASFSSKPTSQSQFLVDASNARGLCLSTRDKLALRRSIAQMITLGLIPSIETRIFNLNISVTNGKKGVKNVFKSLWRKPKESAGINSSIHSGKSSAHGVESNSRTNRDVKYRFDSIESQTRLLADTLFLMRDFEASLGMYRLIKDDYKIDGNLFHYASVHEMMALCLHFMDPYSPRNTREVVQLIQTAIYLYTRTADEENVDGGIRPSVASSAKRCATRLCLVLSSTRTLCKNRDMEIAHLLASASSSETPLGAAVLLEQSSAHYYRAGMYRKFGFHMLMAGHMFRSANQEQHAIRCFTSAMYIFDGGKRRWDTLSNHLTSALAAQLYGMERMGLSLQLYARLLGSQGGGRVSVRSQQKFLDHLNEICKKHRQDAIVSTEQMKLLGNTSTSKRSKHETSRFDELLEHTPMAERVLEIPNMQLPQIFDTSLLIQVDNSSRQDNPDVEGMPKSSSGIMSGTNAQGSESVWNDMICSTEAELRVSSSTTSPLLSTEDWIQSVISEIDEERTNTKLVERSRKLSHNGGSPGVRARMESISVTFAVANPLGIHVPMTQIQLVARLKCASTGRVFTNEGAIHIPPVKANIQKTTQWSFSGSNKIHEIAQFSRISPQSVEDSYHVYDQSSTVPPQPWLSAFEEGVHPFFVVTKSNMAINPGEKKNITLGICPLVMGDLDIVGVRLKIFDEVWVYHKFKIVHPLLHNTAFNRSNRARGESYILRSKIECDMPNLSVDVVPLRDKVIKNSDKGTILQGQISQSLLRISNRGTAPASGILIKTNVPWISILGCKESIEASENGDSRETSFCIGPTGTLMRVPLRTEKRKNQKTLSPSDVLHPGETVDIPIEVRTSGGGRQDFYMLFRYELYNGTGTSSNACSTSSKLRWLRKMSSIAVYPSLTVTASLMPSHLKKYDHILSIEMTNYRSDAQSKLDIILDKVCVASKRYSIKPMAGQTGKNDNKSGRHTAPSGVSDCGLQIGRQEQVTLHYLISPLDVNEAKCTYSHCLINGEGASQRTTDSLVTDFICLEHAHDRFQGSLEDHQNELIRLETEKESEGQPRSISQIRRAKTNTTPEQGQNNTITRHDRTSHPTSTACLCSPQHSNSEINLICSWIATGSEDVINGQHHLRQLAVRPQHKSTGCPLIISAQHESSVIHDFSYGPLNVEMEITIRNRVVQSKVDFAFSMSEQPDIDFMGAESFRWNLDGNGEMTFPLRAVIFSAGVYDLQCVKLTVYQSGGTETSYVFPLQWIIKVD